MSKLALDYRSRVKGVNPDKLIAYYPLFSRANSATVEDHSLQANHGTAYSCTLNDGMSAVGKKCPLFDGSASYINIYSSALNSDFSTSTGAVNAWFRVLDPSVYKDSTVRRIITIGAHATTDLVLLEKTATANTFRAAYIGGGTTDSVSPTFYDPTISVYDTRWHMLTLVWDTGTANKISVYADGVLSSTSSSLGTWSGALLSTACVIGSSATTAANVWSGWLSDIAVWSTALDAAAVDYLYMSR